MSVKSEGIADLKPCPWCGRRLESIVIIEGSTFRWRMLQGCCTDGPEVRYNTLSGDPAEAEAEARELSIAAWNERDPAITALERERDELRAKVEAMRRDALLYEVDTALGALLLEAANDKWPKTASQGTVLAYARKARAAIDAAMREGGDG